VVAVAPIGIGVLLSALYFRIDVFLIERWAGTVQVGVYNAVFRIVDALRLFPAAVLAVALPELCRAGDERAMLRVAARLTSAAACTGIVLWWTAPILVPALYGPAFASGVPAFRVLLLSFPLMALNYVLTYQLLGWHGQRAYAIISAAALCWNVAVNWRLIPALGITGAAWTTLSTEGLLTVGCIVALMRSRPANADAAGARPASVSMVTP
jgi:O-antigen/teichoic acid export membrane protein